MSAIPNTKLKATLAAGGVALALALTPAGAQAGAVASCGTGGIAPGADNCGPVAKAKLLRNGMAIPPRTAPKRVKRVIWAANRIRNKPYLYGGGHRRWWDRGYDCSGAVSFALRGGSFIGSPVPSGSLMRWGNRGRGRWITVYAHGGHTYAVIAGLRWDTSGNSRGTGPSWHRDLRGGGGFVSRHPRGF